MRFRLIHLGRVERTMEKEYDGPYEANMKQIESDVYDGMDPLQMAKHTWIEATEIPNGG